MTRNCHFEEMPGWKTESNCHRPIWYTWETKCEHTYFNIHNCSDDCISQYMLGTLLSSYEPGYCFGSILRVPNRRDIILFSFPSHYGSLIIKIRNQVRNIQPDPTFKVSVVRIFTIDARGYTAPSRKYLVQHLSFENRYIFSKKTSTE